MGLTPLRPMRQAVSQRAGLWSGAMIRPCATLSELSCALVAYGTQEAGTRTTGTYGTAAAWLTRQHANTRDTR